MNWFSVAAELQRDWRNDVEGFGLYLLSIFQVIKISLEAIWGLKESLASKILI